MYYGMVKLLPSMLGKAPSKLVRVTEVVHLTKWGIPSSTTFMTWGGGFNNLKKKSCSKYFVVIIMNGSKSIIRSQRVTLEKDCMSFFPKKYFICK